MKRFVGFVIAAVLAITVMPELIVSAANVSLNVRIDSGYIGDTYEMTVGDMDLMELFAVDSAGTETQLTGEKTLYTTISSDNEDIVSIGGTRLKANAVGTAVITVEYKDDTTLSKVFSVIVSDYSAPVHVPSLFNTQKLAKKGVTAYSNKICLIWEHKGDTSTYYTYQVYRATKKNSGYKKVCQRKVSSNNPGKSSEYYQESTSTYDKRTYITVTDKKKLKPDKKYYYKIRVKVSDSGEWTEFSKPVVLYTSPKRLSFNHIYLEAISAGAFKVPSGFKVNGRTVSWDKIKGAKGYVVTESYRSIEGYNVFGQEVSSLTTYIKSVKKPSYTAHRSDSSIDAVAGYSKHGGYYYADGFAISKKSSKWNLKSVSK